MTGRDHLAQVHEMIDPKTPIASESYDKAWRNLEAQTAQVTAPTAEPSRRVGEQRLLDVLTHNALPAGLAQGLADGPGGDA